MSHRYRAFLYLWPVRAILILLTSILMSDIADAQSAKLAGTVRDADTKEPLFGVNIILTGTNFGASSDFDGTFTIEDIPAGEYNIQFTYIGYEKTLFTGQKF